jgi:hypothetical protein
MFTYGEVIGALQSDHLRSDRLRHRLPSDHHLRQNALHLLNNRRMIREANPKDHGKPERSRGMPEQSHDRPAPVDGRTERSRGRPEPIRSLDPTGERYTVEIHRKILGGRNNLRTATPSGLPSVIRTLGQS